MTKIVRIILQWVALVIGFGLLIVSVTAWLDGGAGRLPSAIGFGACGWMLLPVALSFGGRKNGNTEQESRPRKFGQDDE